MRQAPTAPGRGQLGPVRGHCSTRTSSPVSDAVVCLSGAGVGDHRWTDAYKRRSSTAGSTPWRRSRDSLAECGGPRIMLAASAVGYYGDTGDRTSRRMPPPGDSFLAEVCVRWEARSRTGPRGRSADCAPAHRARPLRRRRACWRDSSRSSRQGWPGGSAAGGSTCRGSRCADEVRAIKFILEHEVSGALNLTAPKPATNAEFMTELGACCTGPRCCARRGSRCTPCSANSPVRCSAASAPFRLRSPLPGSTSSTPSSRPRCAGRWRATSRDRVGSFVRSNPACVPLARSTPSAPAAAPRPGW